jgi:hypothetical protein
MNESALALTLLALVPVMVPVLILGRRFAYFLRGQTGRTPPTRSEFLWTAGAMVTLLVIFTLVLVVYGAIELAMPIVICLVIAAWMIAAAARLRGS